MQHSLHGKFAFHSFLDILFLVWLILFLSPYNIDVGFICISKDIHKILASNLYFYFLQDHWRTKRLHPFPTKSANQLPCSGREGGGAPQTSRPSLYMTLLSTLPDRSLLAFHRIAPLQNLEHSLFAPKQQDFSLLRTYANNKQNRKPFLFWQSRNTLF